MMDIISGFSIAYMTYFVGTSSPGPANLAIINMALQHGRAAGVSTAMGVVTGSVMWGLISAFGLGAALLAWPNFLHVLSLFGGLYLCWLGWRAFRNSQTNAGQKLAGSKKAMKKAQKGFFLYGLGLHLTNPKAMFVWMSIIALGLPEASGEPLVPLLIVVGCGLIGIFVFGTYALAFSNPAVMQGYLGVSRVINLLIAMLFTAAGFSLFYRSAMLLLAT